MTLLPQFQIGIFNAWLPFMFYFVSTSIISYIVNEKGYKRGGDISWVKKKDKQVFVFSQIAYFTVLILTVWIPIKPEQSFFWVGIAMYFVSLILAYYTGINFVTTPLDKPVTKGIYKIGRNPNYIINALIVISCTMMSGVWIIIIALIPYIVSIHYVILAEERYCKEIYKNEYEIYLKNVKRYIFF